MQREAHGGMKALGRWAEQLLEQLERAGGVHWYVGEGKVGPWRWWYRLRMQTLEEASGHGRSLAPLRRR